MTWLLGPISTCSDPFGGLLPCGCKHVYGFVKTKKGPCRTHNNNNTQVGSAAEGGRLLSLNSLECSHEPSSTPGWLTSSLSLVLMDCQSRAKCLMEGRDEGKTEQLRTSITEQPPSAAERTCVLLLLFLHITSPLSVKHTRLVAFSSGFESSAGSGA